MLPQVDMLRRTTCYPRFVLLVDECHYCMRWHVPQIVFLVKVSEIVVRNKRKQFSVIRFSNYPIRIWISVMILHHVLNDWHTGNHVSHCYRVEHEAQRV